MQKGLRKKPFNWGHNLFFSVVVKNEQEKRGEEAKSVNDSRSWAATELQTFGAVFLLRWKIV